MQPEFHIGAVTRPLSAILQLAMMGCPALRARGELAAGACAPVLGWDRGGSSSETPRSHPSTGAPTDTGAPTAGVGAICIEIPEEVVQFPKLLCEFGEF